MFKLEGRVALITGAGRGVGQGIAEGFARAGAQVVGGARDAARGEGVVAEVRAAGRQARGIRPDVGMHAGVTQLVDTVLADLGAVDVLVHNARVFPMVTIDDLTDGQLEETLSVNLKAAFWFAKTVAPSMRERGRGRILFTSSVTGP